MEKEKIICVTLSKKPWKPKLPLAKSRLAQKCRIFFLGRRWRVVLFDKRCLSCKGSLKDTELIVSTLPVTFEELRQEVAIRNRMRKQIEHILLQYENARLCAVLYQEELEEIFLMRSEIDSRVMAGIVQEILLSHADIEEAIVVDYANRSMDVLREMYQTLNRLTILTDEIECYEAFVTEVYEETGLVVACQSTLLADGVTKGTPLVVDMCPNMSLSCRQIPRGSVYVDFSPNSLKRRQIQLKRNDIYYVNPMKFLDSY